MRRGVRTSCWGGLLIAVCALAGAPVATAETPTPDPAPVAQPAPAGGSKTTSRPSSASQSASGSSASSAISPTPSRTPSKSTTATQQTSSGSTAPTPAPTPAKTTAKKAPTTRKIVEQPVPAARKQPAKAAIRPVVTPPIAAVVTSRVALVRHGDEGARRFLIPAVLAVALAALLLSIILWRKGSIQKPAERRPQPTDTGGVSWMNREQQWLLDGKHAYFATTDTTGVEAFGRFLESRGVPFVVDRRDDAVVFSQRRRLIHSSVARQGA